MLYIFISLVSFIAGIITLFFSFGLNVVLIPLLNLFMPITLALTFSGITFLFYNFLRLFLTWNHISWLTVLKFTPFALIGVGLGGCLLNYITIYFTTRELKIFIGVLLLFLVLLEFFNVIQKLKLKETPFLFIGGFISGLAGGLTGFQGPFRAASLFNLKLDYQTFLATNTMLGLIIDGSRIIVYFFTFLHFSQIVNPVLLFTIAGSVIGFLLFFRFTNKMKMEKFKPVILVFIVILVLIMMIV